MTTKPEALRLADELESNSGAFDLGDFNGWSYEAAAAYAAASAARAADANTYQMKIIRSILE